VTNIRNELECFGVGCEVRDGEFRFDLLNDRIGRVLEGLPRAVDGHGAGALALHALFRRVELVLLLLQRRIVRTAERVQ
jgi:hypothetical protein